MELWDLYTKDRDRTNQTMVRGTELPEGLYHVVVHLCLFNSKGEMLIQQRQPFKEGWPDMWDITVGGSAVSGDSSWQAVERETKEELGLELDFSDLRPALTVSFHDGFDDMYVFTKDIDLNDLKLQEEEVQAVKWADKDEILKMLEEGVFIPYHKALIELLFYLKDHEGAHTGKDSTAAR